MINYHTRPLQIGSSLYQYFRIKIIDKNQQQSWVIYSTKSLMPMLLIPSKLQHVYLFFLDASEFVFGPNKNLFNFIKQFLENFQEKEYLAQEVWLPMFEKKVNLSENMVFSNLIGENLVFQSFFVSFMVRE